MDRLDTWLNAQRGWRRLALIAASGYAPLIMVGFYSWLCLGLWVGAASGGPTLPALAICAILAMPVAVGLVSVGAMMYARQARNPSRKQALPPFIWRMTVLFWLMLAASVSGTFVAHEGSSTGSHRLLGGLQLIFAIAVIALAVETLRYRRRLVRARIE